MCPCIYKSDVTPPFFAYITYVHIHIEAPQHLVIQQNRILIPVFLYYISSYAVFPRDTIVFNISHSYSHNWRGMSTEQLHLENEASLKCIYRCFAYLLGNAKYYQCSNKKNPNYKSSDSIAVQWYFISTI